MQVTFNYNLFRDKVALLISILKSKGVAGDDKNLILDVKPDSVSISAFSPTVTARTVVGSDSCELEGVSEDGVLIALPVSTLDTFLAGFTTTFSQPLDVTITKMSDYELKVTVTEEVQIDEMSVEEKETHMTLNTKPPKQGILHRLQVLRSLDNDSEFVEFDEDLAFKATCLVSDVLPYVPDTGTKTAVALFSDDYAIVTANNYQLRYKNILSDVINKGGIGYPALQAFKSVLKTWEDVSYFNDTEVGALVLKSGDSAMALSYATNPQPINDLAEKIPDDNWFAVNREVFKAYMGRLKSVSNGGSTQKVSFALEDGANVLNFATSEFDTSVRVLDKVSTANDILPTGLEGYNFSAPVLSIDLAFFGEGEGYAPDLRFGFAKIANKIYMKYYDSSNGWSIVTNFVR